MPSGSKDHSVNTICVKPAAFERLSFTLIKKNITTKNWES